MIEATRSIYPSQDSVQAQKQAEAGVAHEAALEDLERKLMKATAQAEQGVERIAELEERLERAQRDVVELSRALIRETHLREAAQGEIADLRSSTSWRITKPLRGIRLALGRRG